MEILRDILYAFEKFLLSVSYTHTHQKLTRTPRTHTALHASSCIRSDLWTRFERLNASSAPTFRTANTEIVCKRQYCAHVTSRQSAKFRSTEAYMLRFI